MSHSRQELLKALEHENRLSSADGVLYFQAVAQRSGLNLTDLQCITILLSSGPMTAGQLAEAMGLTTGAITGLVNRLDQRGYVRREKDPSDARRVVVHPVLDTLKEVGAGFLGEQEGVLERLTSEFDDRDLAVLLRFMQKANAFTRAEIDRIRDVSGAPGNKALSAPLAGVSAGHLVFAHGAQKMTIRADSSLTDLYRAQFEGTAPAIQVEGGEVTVSYSRRARLLEWRAHPGAFHLATSVPWTITVRGGASHLSADLRGIVLTGITIGSGFNDLDISLPHPSGTVPIRLSGGAARATIRRPEGSEARFSLKGGAAKLTFDHHQIDAVAGKIQFETSGYAAASDRYDFEITGGASDITLV